MMSFRFFDWLDHRTGCRQFAHEALYERIPGGARWRYVWGSTLTFAFFVQVVTGIVLWMHYSPSTQTAWESVYFIEFQLTGGWLLRGVHNFMAQAMIVLMALHLMQVVIDGAYRAPREINFWLGLFLMLVVFGLGLTGYLLPWDQKGYWATQVATKIVGITPLVGQQLKAIIVGGNQYGHLTLTRFLALHAGVLPVLMMGLVVLHLAMFRRHGITAKDPDRQPDGTFWPDQALRDGVACLAVLVIVCVLAATFRAELGAPADPAVAYNAARPEWYYLFLFQFLKLFHGETGEVLGAIVIPGLVFGLMCLMPILGHWKLGHCFNIGFLLALVLGAVGLTASALFEDFNGETEKSREHISAVNLAHAQAERAHQLASEGIPPAGMLSHLRADPAVAGYQLFKTHCATCHNHVDPTGQIDDPLRHIENARPTAANLFNFGSRAWVAGILDPAAIRSVHYFGYEGSPFLNDDGMVAWVQEYIQDAREAMSDEEKTDFNARIADVAATMSAEASLPGQVALDRQEAERIERGRSLIIEQEVVPDYSCVNCHKFYDEGYLGLAPDLTGYASRQWLIDFVSNPEHERFYPETNDRMPAFAPEDENRRQLSTQELGLIVDWLRGDWSHVE